MPSDQETPGAGGGAPVRSADDEISLWEVLAVLLRRRGWIVGTTLAVTVLSVAFALLRHETFTTTASFSPQGSEASASDLLALASQFGVNVGGGSEGVSPAFYAELLGSREILYRVATQPYTVEGVDSHQLSDILEVDEDTEGLRLEKTIDALRDDAISISTGRETGIVTVDVKTKWPELSKAIADRLIEEVSAFNMNTRQTQAAAERKFIEERVDSAEAALRAAEADLQAFLQANRVFDNSPELTFQHERLQRTVSLRQQVFTQLVQSFEQARISEVRDTPVITVLQPPYLPPGPDERRLLLFLALGVVLGGMAGIVMAFIVEAFKRPAAGSDPAREDFQRTWEGLRGSFGFGRRASS